MNLPVLVLILAFVSGLVIHQGGTCAVAAVETLIRDRRVDQFLAFLECGLWAMLTLWATAGSATVPGWAPLIWLSAGCLLFGLGAAINGACAFGSIAALGAGRLDFLLTGMAAWAGLHLVPHVLTSALLPLPFFPDLKIQAPAWTPLLVLPGIPALMAMRRRMMPGGGHRLIRLSAVMALIGVIGTLLSLLHQPWPWLPILRGNLHEGPLTLGVMAALIFGALSSGVITRKFQPRRPTLSALRDRSFGGALMGAGAALTPGGNDALVFYGLPSASPSAFWGYMLMLAAIGAGLLWIRGLQPFWRRAS